MKKPILFVLYISVACCIGFIGGAYFSNYYSKNIVLETIHNHDETKDILDWYGSVVIDKTLIESLSEINDLKDVQIIRKEYINNALSNIQLFRQKAALLKEKVPNPKAIIELEKSIAEMEQSIIQ